MAFFLPGFGGLFYLSVLLLNSVAILSEDRFLARIGWGNTPSSPSFGASHDSNGVKAKIVNFISSTRTLTRIPLIGLNLMVILYELLLG